MKNDPDGAWSQLRFEEAVLAAFGFLTSEYGFRQEDSTPSCVRYEGNGVVVAVSHDRNSFEITATVEREHSGEQFTAWEIARLAGAPDVDERTSLQASTPDRVENLVPALANTLKRYGGAALRGDEGFYLRLRELQWQESERFLSEGRLSWVRQQAREAWQNHDYKRVVQLLEEVRGGLSAAELKKLSYARKQMRA